MYKIKVDLSEPIDARWHSLLSEATRGITETFVLLMPDQSHLKAERDRFFDSGCLVNPDLRPPSLNGNYLKQAAERLTTLQQDIVENEPNAHIRSAYVNHIEDYVTNLDLLQAVVAQDHTQFIDRNVALYGMPDTDIFAAVCAWIRQDASFISDESIVGLRDKVLHLIPDMPGDSSLLLPSDTTFDTVRKMHFTKGGYFDQLFAPDGPPEMAYIEQEYGDDITRQAISNVGSRYTIKSAADGLWAVLSRSNQVVRPLGYRVDRDYFIGVIAHEVGSHLLEETNGAKQPLRLLGLGLNGFEKGNEGRAFLREQIVYDSPLTFTRQSSWEYIIMLHLGVSLAVGLHGKPCNFADLYAVLYALHRLWRQRRYPLDTNNELQAQDEAWQLTVRIMKGTDGSGGCYMKDIVYLEGNIGCWNIAKHNPDLLLQADIGKFNVNDPHHIDVLKGLEILVT